jgi:chromosome segregation ATPase
MSWLRFNTAAWVGVVLSMCAVESGHTQTARSGGGASAQLMQQMQQLASERTSLQAENAKLKKDLEALRKDRDGLKNGQQAVEQRAKNAEVSLRQSVSQGQSAGQELAQNKEKMQELVAKFRETLQTLREVEARQTTAQQTLVVRDRELKSCVDHNVALYKLNQEVLTHLEKQSVWTRVAQTEPFTKIKRVQLENLVDEYKDRADDQRVAPPSGSAGQGPAGPVTQQTSTTPTVAAPIQPR